MPRRLGPLVRRGREVAPRDVGATREGVESVWRAALDLYRTGLYPALQLCIRREGGVVLHRAVGHARGNAPGDPPDGPRVPVELETPFCLYSASKAVTAMVIHKLDEERALHLEDRVCDYLPEFGSGGKQWITIRHVLAHRAGIPSMPPGALDLDLLEDPARVVAMLSAAPRLSRPGRRVAYHAVTAASCWARWCGARRARTSAACCASRCASRSGSAGWTTAWRPRTCRGWRATR